jgi:ferredoxin
LSAAEARVVGGLELRIDRLLCVGFEDCVTAAPTLLRMGPDGIATFVEEPAEVDQAGLVAVCRSCPVDALELRDAAGCLLAP